MSNMTHRKPDSATPTGEPASAVRSPRHDLCGKNSLCPRPSAGSAGMRPRADQKREREQMLVSALGQGGMIVCRETPRMRMAWGMAVMGCVAVAALFAFALIAV